eukprot:CAMPEP_0185788872 /NCGR_PEP_ID=MMETSP1174-20130828/148196_1 /TAXON_ID=35687 /ORGANISM="Dictyocha speculum, Strain CCMP1381" /LENGTH=277 /DNA_ID=CAMNT_0028482759 /DNA_START=99 /DNA_END=932 /DNA_ORIENTATION=-
MAQVQPDIVAVQEGRNGLDIRAEASGYLLETVASADAPSLQLDDKSIAAAGAVTNQLLLNQANNSLQLCGSWTLLTNQNRVGHESPKSKLVPLDVPRFAVGVRVQVQGQQLDVVCTHLTGGRVDDMRWMELRDQRFKEMQCIINERYHPRIPMVILGDFNAPKEVSKEHAESLGATTDEDMVHFNHYMVGVHDELEKIGWRPAYRKHDLSMDTSAFGSSVDWCYLSPNWPENWVIGNPRVIDVIRASDESWASYSGDCGLQLSLSDHNPVMFDIVIE